MEPTLTLRHANPAVAGTYPFPPLDDLTGGELHLIKVMSGVRAGELQEALEAGDFDVILGIAAVALKRSGRKVPNEALMEMRPADIEAAGAFEEDASEDPLPVKPDAEKTNGSASSSGQSSEKPSANPANGPSRTGSPLSAITAT